MQPTIEDLERILSEWTIKPDVNLATEGLCRPDIYTIFYNPLLVPNEKEHYLTLFHEIVHALDPCEYLPHDEVERIAVRCYEDEELLSCLKSVGKYENVTVRFNQ